MDRGSQVPHADALSAQPNVALTHLEDKEQSDGYNSQGNDEASFRIDDRSGRVHPTVDVAEVIRRWTHALQRIHKQSLLMVCCLYYFHANQLYKKRGC